MHMTKAPIRKSRSPTQRPPAGYRRPQPQTQKERCANQLGLDQMATVEYGNRLVRIKRPRAQGCHPPPDAGTGTTAFNAPATFSPISHGKRDREQAPVQTSHSMAGCSEVVETSRQDLLETPKVSARSARLCAAPNPRAGMFLPREGSGGEGRHLNHSDAAAATAYKRAMDKPVQDGAQEQDSGARVIIIKVPRQDGSRPRRYGGLE